MACGCGKTREQRMAERAERTARIQAARAEKARIRDEQRAEIAAKQKAA